MELCPSTIPPSEVILPVAIKELQDCFTISGEFIFRESFIVGNQYHISSKYPLRATSSSWLVEIFAAFIPLTIPFISLRFSGSTFLLTFWTIQLHFSAFWYSHVTLSLRIDSLISIANRYPYWKPLSSGFPSM